MALASGETVHPVESGHRGSCGIRVRDWMAAMAMQAVVAGRWEGQPEQVAEMAYHIADAMLAKRDQDSAEGMRKKWQTEYM